MTLSPTRVPLPAAAGVRGPAFDSTECPSSAFGTFSPCGGEKDSRSWEKALDERPACGTSLAAKTGMQPTNDDRIVNEQTLVNDDDEHVSRKVIYEHSASSGSSKSSGVTVIILIVVAVLIVGFILMNLHR